MNSKYRGAQGLDPAFIKSLEKQFGFDKPAYERFFLMLWNYTRFDFGKSYFRDVSVLQLIKEKLPVSISLGIWMTLLSYLISIPLGIRKAVRDGSPFDVWTSGVIIIGYAIPGFLFAILLIILFAGGSFFQIFPLRGLVSDGWSQFTWYHKIDDYFWHLTLPIISMGLASFATMTLLTKNSFLEELRKQYVLTARAKGCSERQVLYGHIFRNAMLIVIAGFPAAFVSAFFAGSLLIETIFSLDGLGLLSFESVLNRDYPVVFANLYIFALVGLVVESDFRPHLYLDRSPHRFRDAGGVRWTPKTPPEDTRTRPAKRRSSRRMLEPAGPLGLDMAAARLRAFAAQRPALGKFQSQQARLLVAVDISRPVRRHACSPNSSPTTSRSSSTTTARTIFRSSSPIRTPNSATISAPRPIIAIRTRKNSSPSTTPSRSGRRSTSPTRPSMTGRRRRFPRSRPGC